MNRTQQPDIKSFNHDKLNNPEKFVLDNGIKVFVIKAGTQDVCKIDFMFEAGAIFQEQALVAYTCNKMLLEGTHKHTAFELAQLFDQYGSHIDTSTDKDFSSISLYSLNKHLEILFPVLEEVIKRPVFPEKEFNILNNKNLQEYFINQEKVKHVARVNFHSMVFGDDNFYGKLIQGEDFQKLEIESLKAFYHKYFHSNNCQIILSGQITDLHLNLLNKYFGQLDWTKENTNHFIPPVFPQGQQTQHLIERKDAMQSALRLGKLLFNRTHSDYVKLNVLNTILGGYFGSRLMSNIREDKGYTYGISSSIVSLKRSGFFTIATEVGVDVTKVALDEIYKEIRRLREEPVSEMELRTVKNYMLGSFLRSVDGPFALAEKFRSVMIHDLDFTYFVDAIKTIETTSAAEIQSVANQYLSEDSLLELVVGKK